jgi:hypothetical protein
MGKEYLKRFAKFVKRELEEKDSSGLIQFAPFQINGTYVREILQEELPITFVNLAYGKRDLDRRIHLYLKKENRYDFSNN